MLSVLQIPALNDNYIYLIHDPESGETAVVDPADAEVVLNALTLNNWHLTHILNTHHHYDHVGGNEELKQKTGCTVIASQADHQRIPRIDRGVSDGDFVKLGRHEAKVISTPGHTTGHIVFFFDADKLLFCGDTLFSLGCGRLFEGSAEQMWHSLQKLKTLPPSTKVYCAHEYTQANGRFALTVEPDNLNLKQKMIEVDRLRAQNLPTIPSTIESELENNPFLREDSPAIQQTLKMPGKTPVETFAAIRRLKDNF